MDDQVIKDEILEAESVIRGLAQHMQDAAAVTQAAEVAKRGLSDATSALLGASAQFESLRKLADDAMGRVDNAARELIQRSHDTLSTASGEIAKGAQDLLAARADLSSAAHIAAAAAEATSEKAGGVVSKLEALSSRLSSELTEAANSVTSALSKQIQDARAVAANVDSHLGSTRTEMQTSFSRSEGALEDVKKCLDKCASAIDEKTSSLQSEIRDSRAKAAKQTTAVEANLGSRLKAADTKLVWMIVLQAVTTAAAAAMAIKILMH